MTQTQTRGRQSGRQDQNRSSVPAVVTESEDQKRAMIAIASEVAARTEQLTALLAGSVDPDRFITVALQAIQSKPALLRCTRLSLLGAIRDAATYGLEPAGMLGDAAIVPYKNIATLRIEYRGLRKLALRDGTVAAIDASLVYEGDDFRFLAGSTPGIHHEPALDRDEKAKIRGGYAWARLANGEVLTFWMGLAAILKRRNASPDYRRAEKDSTNDSIWHLWPEEQMTKTVLRRFIVEKLPMNPIARQAIAKDTEAEIAPAEISVSRIRPTSGATQRVLARMGLSEARAIESGALPAETAAADGREAEKGDTDGSDNGSGDPGPSGAAVEPNSADVAGVPGLCGAPSPYADDKGGGCRKLVGHEKGEEPGSAMHKGAGGETWKDEPAA